MRYSRARILVLLVVVFSGLLQIPAQAEVSQLTVADDKAAGYKRSSFKHWIDADKNGCNTRAEVLIEEAIVKPKIGPKCKITGGKWFSAYDGKTITDASKLDVDHLVPLAEAWRSGAWKWTAAQRQAFANDLENPEALIAVTASTNRSKGDKDPVNWLPKLNQCSYLEYWVSVKQKYSLTIDSLEASFLRNQLNNCGAEIPNFEISTITKPASPVLSVEEAELPNQYYLKIYIPRYDFGTSNDLKLQGRFINFGDTGSCLFNDKKNGARWNDGFIYTTPIDIYCYVTGGIEISFYTFVFRTDLPGTNNKSSDKVNITIGNSPPTPTPTPTPTQSTSELVITPGAFCSPTGAIGKSTSGVTYTCKTSTTDARNRWRQ
jgi:hypothetical protein